MPTTFLDLPGELRNRIYRLVLVCPQSLQPKVLRDRRSHHAASQPRSSDFPLVALLRTARTIHVETRSILYGENYLDLVDHHSSRDASLRRFFAHIGRVNARLIRHVRISFPLIFDPHVREGEDRKVVRWHRSHAVTRIEECCPNLRSITTLSPEVRCYNYSSPLDFPAQTPRVREMIALLLKRLDRKLRTLCPGLKRIVVETAVYGVPPKTGRLVEPYEREYREGLHRRMQRLGWKLIGLEHQELGDELREAHLAYCFPLR